ncbi:unnamed protein product [Ixodes pacificus]
MKAARAGHLCTVQFLLTRGADPNRPTSSNDHVPLSLACAGGHLSVVELLLAHGADPSHRLKDNSTMLIEASKGGHTAVLIMRGSERVSRLQRVPARVPRRRRPRRPWAHPPPPARRWLRPRCPGVAASARRAGTLAGPRPWWCAAVPRGPGWPPSRRGTSRRPQQLLRWGLPAIDRDPTLAHKPALTVVVIWCAPQGLRPSERLEACINSMMRSAELNHPSREEQILQKQQILEELQRVERELQVGLPAPFGHSARPTQSMSRTERSQTLHVCMRGRAPDGGGMVLSGHHHLVPPCEEVEELNLRNAALSSSPSSPPDLAAPSCHLPSASTTATPPVVAAAPLGPAAAKRHLDKSPQGAPYPPSPLGPTSVASFAAPAQGDEGLMVAAPARTLHETLGEIVSGGWLRQSLYTGRFYRKAARAVPKSVSGDILPTGNSGPAVAGGVDLNWQTESNHDTALTLACAGGHEELVGLLLSRGAHLEHRDKKGFTPLMLAATAGHAGVVDILLSHGADLEAHTQRGNVHL